MMETKEPVRERKGIGASSAVARAEAGGDLTLLFTSTMLSGLRAGVLCGLAIAGPGGLGTVPQGCPPRCRCTARPAGPRRPAPGGSTRPALPPEP